MDIIWVLIFLIYLKIGYLKSCLVNFYWHVLLQLFFFERVKCLIFFPHVVYSVIIIKHAISKLRNLRTTSQNDLISNVDIGESMDFYFKEWKTYFKNVQTNGLVRAVLRQTRILSFPELCKFPYQAVKKKRGGPLLISLTFQPTLTFNN